MNLRNIFKEYQSDPRVFRNLKIGFAALVVLGILLLFVVSPGVRHLIGIGGGRALPSHTVRPSHHHNEKVNQNHQKKHRSKRTQLHHITKTHKHSSKKNTLPMGHQGSHIIHTPEGSTSPISPEHHHESGNPGSPSESPPNSPPSSQPTETPGKGSEGPSGGESTTTTPPHEESKPPVKVEVTPPKIEAELNVPPITTTPSVETITGTVNETVNGVTGTVEETVNGLGTPIHIEVPELCLIHC